MRTFEITAWGENFCLKTPVCDFLKCFLMNHLIIHLLKMILVYAFHLFRFWIEMYIYVF